MGKKVYEIAKEIGVESKQIIERVRAEGVSLKSHLDSVNKEIEEKIKKIFSTPRPGDIVETQVQTTVKRRRTIKVPAIEEVPLPAPEIIPPPVEVKSEIEIVSEKKVEKEIKIEKPEEKETCVEEKIVIEEPQHVLEVKEALIIEKPEEIEEEIKKPHEQKFKKGRIIEEEKEEGLIRIAGKEKRGLQLRKFKEEEEIIKKGKRLVYDRRGDIFALRDHEEVAEFEVRQQIPRKKKIIKGRKPLKPIITIPKAQKRIIKIEDDFIQVIELAKRMGIRGSEVLKKLLELGVTVSITQSIDINTAQLIAESFGFSVVKAGFDPSIIFAEEEEGEKNLKKRPPVVTIIGHVDHGKTTLLDKIRKSHIADEEEGGITQHIGAYNVELPKGRITFLDTPGHESFTAMRARGIKVTDIVVLVVAADDGVQAQTIEAINHAREANTPIIVAINKIDKLEANPDVVTKQLSEYGLIPEKWGGQTIFCEISAKHGKGIDNLLEMILLQAEMLELKANPNKKARGVVIESRLDKSRGPLATVIVQQGTLRKGEIIISGNTYGKARQLLNEKGLILKEAGPSMPVEITGWISPPKASEKFVVVDDEKKAKEVIEWINEHESKKASIQKSSMSLDDLYAKYQEGEIKELKIILKADVQGSLEALEDAISKIYHKEIQIKIIHSGIGNITETDINFAIASNGIIIGFQVKIEPSVRMLPEMEQVDIRLYSIIYDVVSDLQKAMEGMLAPKVVETLIGKALIKQIFNISKIGNIAGVNVVEGKILRNAKVKIKRNDGYIYEGKITSLKRFKDDVKEVKEGFECGIGFEKFTDLEIDDVIEVYEEK